MYMNDKSLPVLLIWIADTDVSVLTQRSERKGQVSHEQGTKSVMSIP